MVCIRFAADYLKCLSSVIYLLQSHAVTHIEALSVEKQFPNQDPVVSSTPQSTCECLCSNRFNPSSWLAQISSNQWAVGKLDSRIVKSHHAIDLETF